jgi:exodeoxyribonuclease V beta subunit
VWSDVEALKAAARELVRRAELLGPDCVDEEGRPNDMEAAGAVIAGVERAQQGKLARLKEGWRERADAMESWIAAQREAKPKCFNGNKMRADSLVKWFEALRAWAAIRRSSCRTSATPPGNA